MRIGIPAFMWRKISTFAPANFGHPSPQRFFSRQGFMVIPYVFRCLQGLKIRVVRARQGEVLEPPQEMGNGVNSRAFGRADG